MTDRPTNVGVLAAHVYWPSRCVKQTQLEQHDGCQGKYTVGLGQTALSLFDDTEDVASILLNAVDRLLAAYKIEPKDIGRLEVGTETLVDKSKSVKTTLLAHLFGEHADVEGVTSTNACYGGTAALLNSVAWVESSAWDGRYAVVVCGDIAVYAPGPARPTGGGGAVAMLIGPDAPLALVGPRATHAVEVYDFYKPSGTTEYATVDGKLSQNAYLTAVDRCWAGLKKKRTAAGAETPPSLDAYGYVCMHSPYNKLVQKGFARLVYGDFLDSPDAPAYAGDAQAWRGKPAEATVADRDAEKVFAALSKPAFASKCSPSDTISRQVGNCYTAAVYMNLVSLVCNVGDALAGSDILLFSYGSGAVATALTIRARETHSGFSLGRIRSAVKMEERLAARTECDVEQMSAALALREKTYGACAYKPAGALDAIEPGAFYLEAVDELYRRTYARAPK